MALKAKHGDLLAELDATSSPGVVPKAFLSGLNSSSNSEPHGHGQSEPPKLQMKMNTISSS